MPPWIVYCLAFASFCMKISALNDPEFDEPNPEVVNPQDMMVTNFLKWKVNVDGLIIPIHMLHLPQNDYNKTYCTEVDLLIAFSEFEKEFITITAHNQKYEDGEVSYKQKLCDKSDIPLEEKQASLNGLAAIVAFPTARALDENLDNLKKAPAKWDWRRRGLDWMSVRDQGLGCGCCWAMTAADALSALFYRNSGQKVMLSDQNFIDCNMNNETGNWGCDGGLIDVALKYVLGNHGVMSSDEYPFEGIDDSCRFNSSAAYNLTQLGFSSYVVLPPGSDELMMKAIYNYGPCGIGMHANCSSIFSYAEGIYDDPTCNSTALNHAVLCIGYGTDRVFGDYWLIKNSWGEFWGDEGYIKIIRGGYLGINTHVVCPIS